MSSQALFPVPELVPENDGYIAIRRKTQYALARRVSPLENQLLLLIASRTTSAVKNLFGRRPEFARIDMEEWQMYCSRGERAIAGALADLEKRKIVLREHPDSKTHRGGYKIDTAAIHRVPLPGPRPHRERTRPALEARLSAGSATAALRSPGEPRHVLQSASQPQQNQPVPPEVLQEPAESTAPRPGAESPASSSPAEAPPILYKCTVPPDPQPEARTPFCTPRQPNLQPDARQPETYSPWGWRCPLILETQPQAPTTSSSGTAVVTEAWRGYGTPDAEIVAATVAACRRECQDATPAEIAHFVHEKGAYAVRKRVENVNGFIRIAVPKCFAGEPFEQFRRERAQAAAREAEHRRIAEQAAERNRREWRAVLDDPHAPEEDRRLARRLLEDPAPQAAKEQRRTTMRDVKAVEWAHDLVGKATQREPEYFQTTHDYSFMVGAAHALCWVLEHPGPLEKILADLDGQKPDRDAA